MAEEIPEDRFKAEVVRLLHTAIKKVDGLETKFDGLETKVDGLARDVKMLSGQFNDVGVMAINDNRRIDDLEKRVSDLETSTH